MQAVAYSTFRANLREFMDQVRDDAAPVLVTSKDESANAVLINARDYENLLENIEIVSNRYLYEKLMSGRKELESGSGQVHELIELEDD
jgi:antitoxin YefM